MICRSVQLARCLGYNMCKGRFQKFMHDFSLKCVDGVPLVH